MLDVMVVLINNLKLINYTFNDNKTYETMKFFRLGNVKHSLKVVMRGCVPVSGLELESYFS